MCLLFVELFERFTQLNRLLRLKFILRRPRGYASCGLNFRIVATPCHFQPLTNQLSGVRLCRSPSSIYAARRESFF